MIKKYPFKKLLIIGDSMSDGGLLYLASKNILSKINTSLIKQINILSPYQNNNLTNGLTFPYLLSKKIDEKTNSGWEFSFDNINSSYFGNNYSCIGARIKSANFNQGLGKLIFNHFNLNNQVNALNTQHVLSSEDLLIINIGSNDLIFIDDSNNSENIINNLFQELKLNFLNLINHGLRNIIIFELMDLGKIPRFANNSFHAKNMTNLSFMFNHKLELTVNEIKEKYKLNILIYPFLSKIETFKQIFIDINSQNSINTSCQIDLTSMMNQGIIKSRNQCNQLNHHFFLDDVHFNQWVHEQIANDLFEFILLKNN